jgi:hypothetical protein
MVDLATSEEFVVELAELTTHPTYVNTKVYQIVMRDDLGNLVLVYAPKLMTAFKHQTSVLFDEVNAIDHEMRRNPHDKTLRDKKNQARNAAWAYKGAFNGL